MFNNPLRDKLTAGETVLNGWSHISSMWSAEVLAHAGYDSITIDMQHGFHSLETAVNLMQVISGTETIPIARARWNDPADIMRLLDAGAYGIICPMINNREECEQFVGACRYPPMGYRSLGPTRARLVFGEEYADYANEQILTIAMVETKEALDHLEDIASVPGLDMIFVGTGDLRLSLISSGVEDIDQAMDNALNTIIAACKQHKLFGGLFTLAPEYAAGMIKRGYQLVTVKTDTMILSEYAQQLITETRKLANQ